MSSYIIENQAQLVEPLDGSQLLLYPIDMSAFLANLPTATDYAHIANDAHPGQIAQIALAVWNSYCQTLAENDRLHFLTQVRWLVEHEVLIGADFSSWPLALPHPDVSTRGSWLSARTQGCALSALIRAYQLTGEDIFLQVAGRAARTFSQDILDGGVLSPLGSAGIFFEEVAVYPATHMLDGSIYALVGLYDYTAQISTPAIENLLQRALKTLQDVISEFDTGFWTYTDLLRRRLTSPAQLRRQIHLLEALARQSDDAFYTTVALRWQGYLQRPVSRIRYFTSSLLARCRRSFAQTVRKLFIPPARNTPPVRVSIPLNSLSTGGILTVLRGVSQVTEGLWDIEYLTRYIDLKEPDHPVHMFGSDMMAPWQFPTIWVYIGDGFRKLFSLMWQGAGYHIFLPQDGVFSAAFSGLTAKLTGARTVCIDHANLTLVADTIYRNERKQALLLKKQPRRLLSALLMLPYWPTLDCIARISARTVDHFLVPGVVGDGIEEICQGFGIPQSRLTRFNSMINVERHIVLSEPEQAAERERKALSADAIVVAIICRLSPEKGLEIALESISQTLTQLEPAYRSRLRVVIAGDGPSRQSLEADVQRRNLSETCVFWGDISTDDVIRLLAISHAFLYTSTRGACMPMAVLEAMASGCAVIATTQPFANTIALADDRGIIVQPGNVEETTSALVCLVSDPLRCRQMGKMARDYVSVEHSPLMFRRLLQRATLWSDLDELLLMKHQAAPLPESKANND